MKNGKAKFLNTLYRPEIKPWEERENGLKILSNNEAPFGKYRKYPYTYPLYKAWANKFDLSVDNILITRGAEEGLRHVFSAFCEPGSYVLRANPTFGMIEHYEELNHAKPLLVDYIKSDNGFHIDYECWEEKIKKHRDEISIFYIAIPDNPTGCLLPEPFFKRIIESLNPETKIIIDKTYIEYINQSLNIDSLYDSNNVDNLLYYDNVIVVESLSKSRGLAGIRSGVVISNKKNIDILRKLRPMEEVNSVAVKESIKALKNHFTANKNVLHCYKWKSIFIKKFENNIKTHTNFLLLKYENGREIYFFHKLRANGILTRIDFDHPCMNGILRIGIGNNRTMKKIVRLLNETS